MLTEKYYSINYASLLDIKINHRYNLYRGKNDKKNVPAEQNTQKKSARFPLAQFEQGREKGPCQKAKKGKEAAHSQIGPPLNKKSFTGRKNNSIRYFGDIATARLLKRNAPCPALRIIIPKAVMPTAVKRNRVKRIFREAFRAAGKANIVLAVYPKKECAGRKMKDAKEFLEKALIAIEGKAF